MNVHRFLMRFPSHQRSAQVWIDGVVSLSLFPRVLIAKRSPNPMVFRFLRTSSLLRNDIRPSTNVFDRNTKRMQKDYAAILQEADEYEHIKHKIAFQIADRIADISRDFHMMFDMGCGRGLVARNCTKEDAVKLVVQGDLSYNSLCRAVPCEVSTSSLELDEENLPFRENIFDLVTSSLSLHWVNDLPGCFEQVLKILVPDGCFLGAAFGGDTLFELRCSLQLAEMEREGGIAPHVSPLLQGHDLANLLTRSGFNLVTVDMSQIVVNYPSMFEVMEDLRGMGENSSLHRRKPLHRDTIAAAAAIYEGMYANEDGTVPATYQMLFFIGWKPDKSQPRPLNRGSVPRGFSKKETV